jgi:hypothetical protein
MARALAAGQGFADPFDRPTGPTAWQPPVLPLLLAGLLRACGGDRTAVMAVVLFFQACVLVGTGLLVVALARQTTGLRAGWAALAFLIGVLCNFSWCFQWTHDGWLVMLALDLLIAGLCWLRPLARWHTAAGWGLFGGLCALVNPIVGFTGGTLSLVLRLRDRAWARLGLSVLAAGLALAPWAIRNYLVFGRWVPVKSNLAYELYQSQCLQPDGLLQGTTFNFHPFRSTTAERQEYNALGEAGFAERKGQQFRQAVRAAPQDFFKRVVDRLLGATLWYEPFYRAQEAKRPRVLWLSRLTHPLPFLGLLVLALSAVRAPLHRVQWTVMGVYLLYLLPYVGISYYERFALPLLAAKVLLVLWAIDRLLSTRVKERANKQGGRRAFRRSRVGL